jgi:hypothetical protein
MRNITKLSLVIISAVLLSACTAKAPTGTENQADEDNTGTEQSQSTSIRDLLAMGQNQMCTVSTSEIDEESGTKTDTQGTIFISGKKMAQEVIVTSTDKDAPNMNMYLISDGTYMYTWNPQYKDQGVKMKITEPEETTDTKDNAKSSAVNLDEKVNVKCSPWTVDSSKFNIPKDIQFTDLSEMMKNIPTMPANVPTGY